MTAAAVIFAPMIEARWREGKDGDSATDRKDAAIAALRELEFEYQTNKVSDEDYATLRARYARQALAARDDLGEVDVLRRDGDVGGAACSEEHAGQQGRCSW